MPRGVWRLPGALAGASLPVTTWWLARTLFPDRPRIAGGAAIVVALSGLGLSHSRVALLDSTAVPAVAPGLACAIKWTGVQGTTTAKSELDPAVLGTRQPP